MATNRLIALLFFLVSHAAWPREAASPAACRLASARPAIADAKTALDANAHDLRIFLRLADAWSDAGCFGDALQVLQTAETSHPYDKELQTRLRVARSLVNEQSYFDNMDRAAKEALLSRATFRCARLADLNSCDDALIMKPDDPELIMAKGDAMLHLNRPGDAISVYRNALGSSVSRATVNAKITAAEAQRETFLGTCEASVGPAARRACESAWLPGAPDEVRVFKRRGLLLQGDNQPAPALDAYMAASRLDPNDLSVALAVVSLSDSTARQDALTLTARGRALLTLGRPSEAIPPLRAALRLAPDLADTVSLLRRARELSAVVKTPRAANSRPGSTNSVKAAAIDPKYSNDAPVTQSN